MKIWNRIWQFILILSLCIFFFLLYKSYYNEKNIRNKTDIEKVNFFVKQIKLNIDGSLQVPDYIIKYLVNNSQFNQIIVLDSNSAELYSVTKGYADTSMINKFINIQDDSIIVYKGKVLSIIPIFDSDLNKILVGKVILTMKGSKQISFINYLLGDRYTLIVYIVLFVLLLLFRPGHIRYIEPEKEKIEPEIIVKYIPNQEIADKYRIEYDEKKKNLDEKLIYIKEQIFNKLNSIEIAISKDLSATDQVDLGNYKKHISEIIENINNSLESKDNKALSLSKKVTNNNNKLIYAFSKIEYFANRLRIFSYNAMIMANKMGKEGNAFKILADEISRLSDSLYLFHKDLLGLIKENDLEIDNIESGFIRKAIAELSLYILEAISKVESEHLTDYEKLRDMSEIKIEKYSLEFKNIKENFKNYITDIFS